MSNEQATGLSGLGSSIRSIMSRLLPLEIKGKAHDTEIAALKERAAAAERELVRLTKVTDQQGTELAQNQAAVAELSDAVRNLETEIDDKSEDIQGLKSALHGERVKRGLRDAKIEKLAAGSKRRGR